MHEAGLGELAAPHGAARVGLRLEDEHLPALVGEQVGADEAVGAAADDDRVGRGHRVVPFGLAAARVLEELEHLGVDGGGFRAVAEHGGALCAAVRARQADDRQHVVGVGRALEPPQLPEHRLVGGGEPVAGEALDLTAVAGHELAREPERLELPQHVEDGLVLAFAGHVLHQQSTVPASCAYHARHRLCP